MLESQLRPLAFSVLHPLHIHKFFNDQIVQKTSAHACALFSIFFDRLVFKSLQLRQKQMRGLGDTPKWEQQQHKLSPACTWVKVHNLVDYWFAPLHSPHLVGPENKGFNAPVTSTSPVTMLDLTSWSPAMTWAADVPETSSLSTSLPSSFSSYMTGLAPYPNWDGGLAWSDEMSQCWRWALSETLGGPTLMHCSSWACHPHETAPSSDLQLLYSCGWP